MLVVTQTRATYFSHGREVAYCDSNRTVQAAVNGPNASFGSNKILEWVMFVLP